MTDTKWSSPTGYSVANRETDKLPPKTSDFLTRGQDDVQDALDDLKTLAREMSVTRHVKFSDCLLHILDDLKRALAQQQPVNEDLSILKKVLDFLPDKKAVANALDFEMEHSEFHRHDDELVQVCVQRIHDLHDYVEQAISRAEQKGG